MGRGRADRLRGGRRGRPVRGGALAWDRAGRWVAGATLLAAAVYELTPFKNVCLSKCRSPLGFLLTSWRNGPAGALRMGAAHGAWCVGCCWALMAALFALGIMSVAWMAFVAGLIAVEKILPWRRVATWGTAGLLLGLGVLMLAAPSAIPGLTIPSGGMPGWACSRQLASSRMRPTARLSDASSKRYGVALVTNFRGPFSSPLPAAAFAR